jgi:TetR/AcrR family transcriptional regulator
MSATAAIGATAILKAATTLFADEGFEGASVAAIAEMAGVCKANVFHHFPSKEVLYFAVMKEAAAVHAAYAEDLFKACASSTDKVRDLVNFGIRHLLADPERARLILREVSNGSHEERGRKLARTVFQRNFSAIVSIFEQGRQRGEFHETLDPAAAAMLLQGAVHIFFNCRDSLREYREAGCLQTPEAYVEAIAGLILSGVLAPQPRRACGLSNQ